MIHLFRLLAYKNNNSPEILDEILQKIFSNLNTISISYFGYLLDGLVRSKIHITDDANVLIQDYIIKLKDKLDPDMLAKISSKYYHLYDEDRENIEVFYTIDYEAKRSLNSLSINDLFFVLRLMNLVALRYPTDLFTQAQEVILEKADTLNPKLIANILTVYSALPLHFHYRKIYEIVSEYIMKDPKVFFDDTFLYVTVIHAFSKIDYFPDILNLYTIYLPKIPNDLLNDHVSLGYFLYSALRRPANLEYENMLINVLYENADKLKEIQKKKITISFAHRYSTNPLFWDNVHKLNIFWKKNELMYVSEYATFLSQYNLIEMS